MKQSGLGVIPLMLVGLSLVLTSCKYEIQVGPIKAEADTYRSNRGPIVSFSVSVPERGRNTMNYHARYGIDGVTPFAQFGKAPVHGP